MGGKWHKAVNRYYLEEEVKKLLNTQLGTMMQILLKGDIKIGFALLITPLSAHHSLILIMRFKHSTMPM